MIKKWAFSFLVLAIGANSFAEPNSVMEVNQDEGLKTTRLTLGPELVMLSRSGKSLTSFAAHFGVEYGLSERFAIGGSLHQGFSSGGFLSPNFTKFSFAAAYALTGGLILKENRVALNSRKVFLSDPYPSGGFRVHATLSEYIFPITNGSLLFPAVGIAGSYEFPSTEKYSWAIGLRWEYLFNAADSLSALQPFVRVLLWI